MANEELSQRTSPASRMQRDAGLPRQPDRFGTVTEVVFVAGLLAYSLVIDVVVPHALYVPTNLVAAAVAVAIARALSVSWEDLGMRPDRIVRGIRVGIVAVVIAAGKRGPVPI
jgi:hypothetical protein